MTPARDPKQVCLNQPEESRKWNQWRRIIEEKSYIISHISHISYIIQSYIRYYLMSHISSLISHISYIISHKSYIISYISHILYHISYIVWNHSTGIMEEESWRSNHGEGIMENESWRRSHWAIIMGSDLGRSWKQPGVSQRHPEGTQEASRRHPGCSQEAQEAPRRLPGGPQEAAKATKPAKGFWERVE